MIRVIKRSCEIKASVVSADEREAGLRAILNFGHTIGHALETVTGYSRFLHGEAVAMGMCAASRIAVRLGLMGESDADRITALINGYGLPASIPPDIDISDILTAMEVDKKFRSGKMRFVLPERIGRVRIEEGVPRDVVAEVLGSLIGAASGA